MTVSSISRFDIYGWHLEVPVGTAQIILRIFKTPVTNISITGHTHVIISHQTLYFDGITSSCEYDTVFVFHFMLRNKNHILCWSFLQWSLTFQISIINFRLLFQPKIVHAGDFALIEGCIHFAHLRLCIFGFYIIFFNLSWDRFIMFTLVPNTWRLRFILFVIGLSEV